ncbi:hypothetical protein HBH98_239290 [Parastagonospora nodorum]|nr:hypothetical protein HBH53_236270 [Parastagonospora nodorum]KAH3987291.1 hypothetical protein HBH52_032520 [Parastagonospora nodorum]KAH4020275.1 hypothetical protein HBI09_183190 [Parastagonospora nodorum]KAH4060390.1 hypothetical protein HBH49_001410 [Parastagonospora nodorum]KAH4073041.1 hypothetical protein HBH50_048790 [Parastagonospora nodorum]
MRFIAPLFTTFALMSTAFTAPTESTTIEVRDSQTNAIVEGLAIDKRQVCYCYGGTCTPGCHEKVKRQVCYCYGGVCTPGCH